MGFVVSLALARPGAAAPVRYDLNSSQELSNDGWQELAGGTATFSGGMLQISSPNYEEWALDRSKELPTSVWWSYVDAARGWWVEARVKADAVSGSPGYGQGLRVNDGRNDIQLKLAFNDVVLLTPEENHAVVDVRAFHVYRLQRTAADAVQLLVDGKQVLNVATPNPDKGGVGAILFGSIDQNMAAVWDYLAYDTAAPGAEQSDDDHDGIPLDRDLCPTLKDDGKDSDWDRLGDACDPCVNDELNDADGDGLCADKDICPRNAKNPDANGNGLCDDDECMAGLPKGYQFAPAGAEGAEVCETAGLQCACYNRAKANCSPKASCGFDCDCRWLGGNGGSSAGANAGAAGTPTANGDPSASGQGGASAAGSGGLSGGSAESAGAASATTPAGEGGAINRGPSPSSGTASGAAGTGAAQGPQFAAGPGARGCALGRRSPSSPPAVLWLSVLGLVALGRSRRRRG